MIEQAAESPRALQLAARVERADPPSTSAICAAAALATIGLLEDDRSQPGGEWYEAVSAWNGDRIRKIVRRARASAWDRAQAPDGVTVARDGAEVRAFVPGPLDEAPGPVAKLQIQSTPLDDPVRVDDVPDTTGLFIAVTPYFEMSWGKQAAQCAHAGQWAWMRSDPSLVATWDRLGRPLTIVHPTESLWETLEESAPIHVRDGGFTEIPPGTKSAIAWWSSDLQRR